MFGCCIAGRLLQTNLIQVDETHAYFELTNASSINHLCVFSSAPFPDGYAATVHFFWPGKGFQLLGMLSNDKPSAIFRLRGTFTPSGTNTPSTAQTTFSSVSQQPFGLTPQQPQDVTAILGLAIEPLDQVRHQMQSLSPAGSGAGALTKAPSPQDAALLAERIIKHLLNYLSSFIGGGMGMLTSDSSIPMGVIAQWYERFTTKLRTGGVGFLERDDY